MPRFIAVIDSPSSKHKMIILPIFTTIEETKDNANRTAPSGLNIKILDIDWDVERQQQQNDLIARLSNENKFLKEDLDKFYLI